MKELTDIDSLVSYVDKMVVEAAAQDAPVDIAARIPRRIINILRRLCRLIQLWPRCLPKPRWFDLLKLICNILFPAIG
jgi:hypothetical protein